VSEHVLATVGGALAAVLLVLLCVRTVVRERRVGVGAPAEDLPDGVEVPASEVPRRGRPVVALDIAGVVVTVALVAALGGRMAVALLHH
jgi:hypothetical protein